MPKAFSNPILSVALAIAALALGLGVWSWQSANQPDLQIATRLDNPRALPEFILTDQDAQTFGPAQLRGRWHLLFFGFTHCPDVCPNTLSLLASVKRKLADDRLQVVFVSVDPGRDTPERLREYVRYFNPDFQALTGTAQSLDAFTAALHVPYLVGEADANGKYEVEHSGSLVLINPQGLVTAYMSPPFSSEQLGHDLQALLGSG